MSWVRRLGAGVLIGAALGNITLLRAEPKKPAPAAPDVLVLNNGDTLHGKLVSATAGSVKFHSDPLGDLAVPWSNIREMHAAERFAVLDNRVKWHHAPQAARIPVGTLDATGTAITVHRAQPEAQVSVPVRNAQYIMDEGTLKKQVSHSPGLLQGWNGSATAGATVVTATQKQYTMTGAVSLVRVVPTVSWLQPRNRMSTSFSGSFGKITQPGYETAATPPVYVPEVVTKTAIYHADAERDEYFSPRFFALAQTAFDHNFSQDLDLQQIYGGGIGWTPVKTARQEIDLKATVQYESQQFISGGAGSNQNLVGSTYSANYALHLKPFSYTQSVAYLPAYNQQAAYSATETNRLAFPAYKKLSFSVGSTDSYLNDPPVSQPPTRRNSFQFTMGLTYAIQSKY